MRFGNSHVRRKEDGTLFCKCAVLLLKRGGAAMAESFDISKKVYDAEDIQKLLGIGRTKAYEFLDEVYKKQEPFRVIKIGKVYRIPCKPFEKWLCGE